MDLWAAVAWWQPCACAGSTQYRRPRRAGALRVGRPGV